MDVLRGMARRPNGPQVKKYARPRRSDSSPPGGYFFVLASVAAVRLRRRDRTEPRNAQAMHFAVKMRLLVVVPQIPRNPEKSGATRLKIARTYNT